MLWLNFTGFEIKKRRDECSMSLFAISDLHLSFAKEKPMDIFGQIWKGHTNKLSCNWKALIKEKDTVLLPGDFSWANNLEEVASDMDFLESLPGKKVFLTGNHDYWWSSLSKVRNAYPQHFFLKNNFYDYQGIAVCGSRGWICPNDSFFTMQDEKIFKRELIRLKISLDMAVNSGYEQIFLMLHFPPTNDKKEESGFTELIRAYPQIIKVIYGHLHGKQFFGSSILGEKWERQFLLVSGDYLDFVPEKLI